MKKLGAIYLFSIVLMTSCEGFFGKKTDLDFIDAPEFTNSIAAYVPILPIIEGFQRPTDVLAGFDELIYVVDASAEEIIGYDQSGRLQGRFKVPGVTKITMDRQLDLLAIGTVDTVINSASYSLSCIYRIDLNANGMYGISSAVIKNQIVHPFYYKSSFSSADALVKFTAIDAMGDNYYYVSRTGLRDNENQVGGPDDGIVLFKSNDTYISNVVVNTGTGIFRGYFKTPSCVTTWAKPRQSPIVDDSRNFFVAMSDPTVPIKVQSIQFNETDFGSSYTLNLLDNSDTSKSLDFLYRPSRFLNPADMTITGDGTNYLFVVDADRDSVYQFTATGIEGVNPPPGSSDKKNIIVSFGGKGKEATQFNRPSAVAYLDEILYVTDEGNGRLLRFKLTTDFD